MSIISIVRPKFRTWSGQGGAYPLATWFLRGGVTGDASGGSRIVQIDFRAGTVPPNGLLWSLEELTAQDSQNTSKSGFAASFNNDVDPATGIGTIFGVIFLLEAVGPSTVARMAPDDQTFFRLGHFLGRQNTPGVAAGIQVTLANVNGATITMGAGGYVWDRIANSVRGGPLRPLEGQYAR